jgi:hypothetical protein
MEVVPPSQNRLLVDEIGALVGVRQMDESKPQSVERPITCRLERMNGREALE